MQLKQLLAFVLFAACVSGVAHASSEESWNFDALMKDLSEHPRFVADFDEKRSSFFLSRPLNLKGEIRFDADKSLEKIVETPFWEHIIIDNDAVVIHRMNLGGKEENRHTTYYSLSNNPFLAKAVQGVSNVFAGDKSLLDELYEWELSGSAEDWELVLKPKGEKLAEFITSITVRGSGGIIDYIHSLEADGDESELTLSNRTEPQG